MMQNVMQLIINIIPTVAVLAVLIFIHELGHFIFAKLSGVCVEKFSIGFGPVILCKKHGGTEYAVSIIPFGGFVKMAGETIEDRDKEDIKNDDFLAQSISKRFFIIFAGPLMNYLLAIALLWAVFFTGKPAVTAHIGGLVDEYPAKAAGLLINDEIIKINGVAVSTWDDVLANIVVSENSSLKIDVLRGKKEMTFNINALVVEEKNIFGDIEQTKKVGIYPSDNVVLIKYGPIESLKYSVSTTWFITKITYESIFRLVTGRLNLKAVSGPLGIMIITNKTAKRGFPSLVQFTAFLSISLAIFNLLPIPALDGGHLLFILCEAVLRRPVSFKLQERFAQIGFALLIVLMVVIVYNDAMKFEIMEKIKNIIPFLQ